MPGGNRLHAVAILLPFCLPCVNREVTCSGWVEVEFVFIGVWMIARPSDSTVIHNQGKLV